MEKVFVVLEGQHDDISIVNIFSFEEMARELVNSYLSSGGRKESIWIEELEVDNISLYFPVTRVEISKDGDIKNIETEPYLELDEKWMDYNDYFTINFGEEFLIDNNLQSTETPVLVCSIKTGSHEIAKLIANERRIDHLTAGTWEDLETKPFKYYSKS